MHFIRLSIIVLAVSIAGAANATIWFFNDPIDESQVVDPTGSPATGTAVGTYDDVTNMLHIEVTAMGFDQFYPPTSAHIHMAPFGVNGGVFHVLGVAGGFNDYTNPNEDFVLTSAREADFLAGRYYVQIHTGTFPLGAIRGQLHPVPEPASLIALGAGALLLARRRRRKA